MAQSIVLETIYKAVDKFTAPLRAMAGTANNFALSASVGLAKFEKGFNKVYSASKGLEDKIFSLRNAMMALALVEGLKKVTDEVLKIAEAGEKLELTSKRFGITAEALKELQNAAYLKGIDPEVFTKSLNILMKNVGAAKLGFGNLNSQIKKVDPGLIHQLKTVKNVNQAMDILATAMGKIKDPFKQAALATAAFGRGGPAMIQMLGGGKKGLDELRKVTSDFGIDINGIAKKSLAFTESQHKMEIALNLTKMGILGGLMPTIQQYMGVFTQWISKHQRFIQMEFQIIIFKITNAVKMLIPILGFLIDNLRIIIGFVVGLWAFNRAMMVIKASMFAYGVVLGVVNFAQGVFAAFQAGFPVALMASKVAMMGFSLAMKAQLLWSSLVTGAQWLFNAALYACPLVWIVLAIAAVIAIIVLLIMHWDKVKEVFFTVVDFIWKWLKKIGMAIIDFLFWPIRLIIKYWSEIKETFFKCVNFMWKWLKKICQGIIDFLLAPLILVLKLISKISGAKWAGDLEQKITHIIPQDDDNEAADGSEKKPINPHILAKDGKEKTQPGYVDIHVMNHNNSNIVTKANIPIKAQTGTTWGGNN